MAKQCPHCNAEACGFRKISEVDFEGFCLKCGATWPEPGKASSTPPASVQRPPLEPRSAPAVEPAGS